MGSKRRALRERQMASEWADHLERRAEALTAQGLTPAEAKRKAAIEFGAMARYAEEARDAWGGPIRDAAARDLRCALRQIRRSPAFAVTAVVTLALAIGANSAMFSLLYAVILAPLPYPRPGRLATIGTTVSLPQFRKIQARAKSVFSAFGVEEYQNLTLRGRGAPRALWAVRVTPSVFRVFGVPPMLGRVFTRASLETGRRNEIVLSHSAWTEFFAASRDIVGQSVDLGGRLFRIAAVMPAGYRPGAALWAPLPLKSAGGESLVPLARLCPGVTFAQAQAVLAAARAAGRTARRAPRQAPLPLIPLAREVSQGSRRPLSLLITAVGLFLLIACFNVAGLSLARNAGRQAEMAMRTALGATRRILLRQLLTESAVLAVFGCALGLLLGAWMLPLLRLLAAAAGMPRTSAAVIGGPTLAFTALLLAAALVLFGLVPSWEASRTDLHQAARPGGPPTPRQRRLREALVAAELALAVAMAFGAGLLLRSYASLTSLPLRFNPHHLLTFSTRLPPGPAHANASQLQARENAFVQAATRRLRAMPGVRAASVTVPAPFQGLQLGFVNPAAGRRPQVAIFDQVGPGYWRAAGAPLLAGRGFGGEDRPGGRPVAIISQALAQRLWPGQSPLGKRLRRMGARPALTVVGEAPDIMQFTPVGIRAPGMSLLNQSVVYLPFAQNGAAEISFLLRTRASPAALQPTVRELFSRLNPTEPLTDMTTMPQRLGALLAARRFYLALLTGMSGLALALAAIGIYGVTRSMASARIGEMGIRKALGATDDDVLRLIMGRAALLAFAGAVAGAFAGLLLARLLTGMLYGVGPANILNLLATATVGVAVGMVAAFAPAQTASRLQPMIALRRE